MIKILSTHRSKNFDKRVKNSEIQQLVIHSTECDLKMTLDILTDSESQNPVSAHYVIDEQGIIYNLVDESKRAWHAGVSYWGGLDSLNHTSIGIELVNISGNQFPQAQMQALIDLSKDILSRYDIPDANVVAHSDIALGRKVDPGPLFDWKLLAQNGIGIHPELSNESNDLDNDNPKLFSLNLEDNTNEWSQSGITPKGDVTVGIEVLKLRKLLAEIGYDIELSMDIDDKLRWAIKAVQSKFRQEKVSGEPDLQTIDIIRIYHHIISSLS